MVGKITWTRRSLLGAGAALTVGLPAIRPARAAVEPADRDLGHEQRPLQPRHGDPDLCLFAEMDPRRALPAFDPDPALLVYPVALDADPLHGRGRSHRPGVDVGDQRDLRAVEGRR